MSEFHFLRPLWLLVLPVVAVLVIGLLRARRNSRGWSAVCDPHLLPFLLAEKGAVQRRVLAPWLVGIAATLLIIALAGPTWQRLPQPVFRDQSALVIALDLSRSMDAGDLKPSRLVRAKHKITDILNSRESGQTALLVYAGEAFTVTPLTDDVDTILAQLTSLDTNLMPAQGSRADRALTAAAELLQQAGVGQGDVLLVTDGIDGEASAAALVSLRKQGHRLSVLGTGTQQGAPIPVAGGGFLKDTQGSIVVPKLNSEALRGWAQRGGGRYAEIRPDDHDIQYLFAGQSTRSLNQAEQADDALRSDQWREQGPWLILLVTPLVALAFRRGVLLVSLPLLMSLPEPADALDWADLWSRPDQQGMRALEAGAAADAAQYFEDPQWKAAAQYRAGQYEQAAAKLEPIKTPDALYNRGNALARLGQYPQAMASYEQALELDPEHADARHNLELLQQMQQQQQAQQQSNQSQQDSPSSGDTTEQAGQQQASQDADGERQHNPSERRQAGAEGEQPQASDQAASESGEQEAGQQAERSEQSSEAQAPATPEVPSSAPEPEANSADLAAAAEQESDEAIEQWLRRIPDDPGGLLRRKFLYQYQQRERRAQAEEEPW